MFVHQVIRAKKTPKLHLRASNAENVYGTMLWRKYMFLSSRSDSYYIGRDQGEASKPRIKAGGGGGGTHYILGNG